MALSLAACGSSASTDTASSSEAASTSTAATTEAAGEGSGAYTGTPIKIGGIGPITGGAAVYGQAVKNAEELAVKEINAANGSDVFEWKFEDDEHDAEKSVNAYNTLKDWGLQVLAGPVTTTPSIAVAAETANDNLFMMTPSASAPAVIESGDNVFQICFTDPNQGVASADYIAEKGYSPLYGARPIKRLLQNEIEDKVAELMLSSKKKDIHISAKDGAVVIVDG